MMVLDAIKNLAERLATMLGINVNGLMLGIATALYFMYFNGPRAKQDAPPQKPVDAPPSSSSIDEEAKESTSETKGDISEVCNSIELQHLI